MLAQVWAKTHSDTLRSTRLQSRQPEPDAEAGAGVRGGAQSVRVGGADQRGDGATATAAVRRAVRGQVQAGSRATDPSTAK